MGAPEILFALFFVAVPLALAWCAATLARRRTSHRVDARWAAREHLSPEDEEFWRKR